MDEDVADRLLGISGALSNHDHDIRDLRTLVLHGVRTLDKLEADLYDEAGGGGLINEVAGGVRVAAQHEGRLLHLERLLAALLGRMGHLEEVVDAMAVPPQGGAGGGSA